jgi:exodeoxyribonuclease VII large subunit
VIDAPTYSVGELARRIGYALEDAFPDDVWVTGEISGLNRSRGGHVYFDLCEPAAEPGQQPVATIPVALFKMNKDVVNKLLKRAGISRMDNGMQVRLRGVVAFYERTGRLQLRMTSIDPTYTLGALTADRDRVLRLLQAEGVLDRNSKLALPLVPLEIGLLTSAGSAAYHDFVHELERSGYAWQVRLVDTPVQGAGADARIEAGLRLLAARGVPLIALVRGGGSRVDLAVFDTERVARAIALLDVPVLTGIGHEIDRSVADDVAHTAYKTPTACAAGLVEQVTAFLGRVERAWDDIAACSKRSLDRNDRHVRVLAEHCLRATLSSLALHEVRISNLADRMHRDTERALGRAGSRLDRDQGRLVADANRHVRAAVTRIDDAASTLTVRSPRVVAAAERDLATLEARVRAFDPVRVLNRGFSLTRRNDGSLLRSAAEAAPGDELTTMLADGEVRSSVFAVDVPPVED